MLHKGFINIVKQVSLLPRVNYHYHPLITKKGFISSLSFTPSSMASFKTGLLHTPKASLSSFKDDFNEENTNQDTILK